MCYAMLLEHSSIGIDVDKVYHHNMRRAMQLIIEDVKSRGGRLVKWSLFPSSDATPTKLVVADCEAIWQLPEWAGLSQKLQELIANALIHAQDAGIVKLLQTEYVISMLVQVDGRFYQFGFRPLVPCQSLARGTAETNYAALKLSFCSLRMEHFQKQFELSERAACTDGDAAVVKSERAHALDDSKAGFLHILCGLHMVCNAREDACSLDKRVITYLKHVVLSLRHGNMLKLFRVALRILFVVAGKVIRDRHPSAMQRNLNEDSLIAALPDTPENAEVRARLLAALPGDWQKSDIELFAAEGETDEDVWLRILVTVCDDLIQVGPHGFPTRNWIDAEKTPQWILRLELPHRLFSRTYPIAIRLLEDTFDPHDPLGEAEALKLLGNGNGMDFDHEGEGMPESEEEDEEENAKKDAGNKDKQPLDDVEIERQKQKTYKKTTLKWIAMGSHQVATDCMVLLNSLVVWDGAVRSELFRSGEEWEKEDEAEEAKRQTQRSTDGVPCAEVSRGGRPHYRITEEYDGVKLQKCIDKMTNVMTDERYWIGLPQRSRTQATVVKGFKYLSRSRARMEHIRRKRANYPHKMFGMLTHPELAREIVEDAKCARRLDPWARFMVDSLNAELDSEEARASVEATAAYARGETHRIECRHGKVRGFLMRRSVQCNAVDLKTLQQHLIFNDMQDEKNVRDKQVAAAAPADQEEEEEPDAERGRALSSWDTFRSDELRGKRKHEQPSMDAVSAKYQKLTATEKAELQRRTDAANDAVDVGNDCPYGAKVVPQKALCDQQPLAAEGSIKPSVGDALAAYLPQEVWNMASAARIRRRGRTQAHVRDAAARVEAIERYKDANNPGAARLQGLEATMPLTMCCCDGGGGAMRPIAASAIAERFDWTCPEAVSVARKIAELPTTGQKQSYNMASALHMAITNVGKTWQTTVQHAEVPVVKLATPVPLSQRLCLVAGRCVCNPRGRITVAINTRTKTHLAQAFQKKNPPPRRRQELTNGNVVVLYVGNLAQEEPVHADIGVLLRWYYICDVALSPYQLFLDEMVQVDGPDLKATLFRDPEDPTKAHGLDSNTVIKLRTTNRSPSQWEVSESLAQFVTWGFICFTGCNGIKPPPAL